VPLGTARLRGDLGLPRAAHGVVVFAHGSGSSRHSPRNQFVARVLERRSLATLLIDLLTPEEERVDDRTGQYRFDIPMLADRLVSIVDWLRGQPDTARLPIGFFGASTGGGAALMAAAARPDEWRRGVTRRTARSGWCGAAKVAAPTLLIVGGHDAPVIQMNREAIAQMRFQVASKSTGATHLFEEPGTLERVRSWRPTGSTSPRPPAHPAARKSEASRPRTTRSPRRGPDSAVTTVHCRSPWSASQQMTTQSRATQAVGEGGVRKERRVVTPALVVQHR
jgi:dienelactone hydrolase